MIPSVLRRVVRMLRIALTVLGAIWRSSRDWDGVLQYDRLCDAIRDGWPAKNDLGEPLPIKMPWGPR